MEKIKVAMLVRGNIICSGNVLWYQEPSIDTLGCRPDIEIPKRFIQRIYHGYEAEDVTKIEYDPANAVEITGDVRIESLTVNSGAHIIATGDVIAGAPADFTPPAFKDDFSFEPVPED